MTAAAAVLMGHVTPTARPLVFAGPRLLRVLAASLLLGTLLPAGPGPTLVAAAPPDDLSNFQGFWPCNTGVRIARAGSEADVQRAVAAATAVQAVGLGQGLTLVHFSAQPEPFLTQKHTFKHPLIPRGTSQRTPTYPLNAPPIPCKRAYVEPKSGRV